MSARMPARDTHVMVNAITPILGRGGIKGRQAGPCKTFQFFFIT